jgi:hypothetical protein
MTWGRLPLRCCLAALLVALAATTAAVAARHAAKPRCFGAAAHDPERPCHNPRLRRMVRPTPQRALMMLDPTPCTLIHGQPFTACRFGVSPARARRTVVLVGDSHADHWRAALYPVALRLRWSVIVITHGSCPFSTVAQDAPSWKRDACIDWNDQVRAWFGGHPEVSAIITSDHPGPVEREPGESMMDAWVRGTTGAWASLPANVKHIVVLRDLPFIHESTLPCVERTIRRHGDASRACGLLRRRVIHHDPAVVAAHRTPGRAQVVDLTKVFCGRVRCHPVIGGALVYKDFEDHLTPVFAATLAPIILRDVRRLTASWN